MARQRKEKKEGISPAALPGKRLKIFIFLAAATAFIILAVAAVRILRPCFARHFLVQEINVSFADGSSARLNLEPYGIVKGTTSLLGINLEELSEQIKAVHPELEIVELSRSFPDRLDINLKKRKPIAQIKVESHPFGWGKDRFVLVDEKGIIFAKLEDMPQENLPVITGTRARMSSMELGKRWESERLVEALLAIVEFNSLSVAGAYRIEKIEVSDLKNVSLWLKRNLELKLGKEDFPGKLALFEQILRGMKTKDTHDLEIDLRFGDGVVRPK